MNSRPVRLGVHGENAPFRVNLEQIAIKRMVVGMGEQRARTASLNRVACERGEIHVHQDVPIKD